VIAEQARLHELGFLYGPVDGVYGEMTRQAIIRWQASQGRALTGMLTSDEVAALLPTTSTDIKPQAPSKSPSDNTKPSAPTMTASTAAMVPTQSAATQSTPVQSPPPQTPPVQVAAAAVPAAAPSPVEAISTVKVGMPYWQARTILTGAGWQTEFVDVSKISPVELGYRAWFTDHHISEAEACSATGCAMQFHNMDGRLLYVFTTSGAKDSDAYRGAGPSVIAVCLDAKDITCPSPQKLTN
jgi:hypothetical protein